MGWLDGYWDDATGLLWNPTLESSQPGRPTRYHLVRDSGWYALGLLLRDGPGDTERAIRTLRSILEFQYDAPDQPYHGTFARAPEEPPPPPGPQEWRDYDPNWREFIITTLAMILLEYEARLPADLVGKIETAMRQAVEGAIARRLPATYTNIALMNAFMLVFAADRLREPGWAELGEAMALETYRLFRVHDTFEEYNSPTYYGVDLYALALWRSYSSSPRLRELGAEMEALLWTDIARFYHAGLRNLGGPFDRSYGMDMRRYASLTGLWIWLAVGQSLAPFPNPEQPFAHAADFCYAPCFALLGARPSPEAWPHLLAFQGERQVERLIASTPRRVATAWIGQDIMLGGEDTSRTPPRSNQLHPATVHWRVGVDEIVWMRLIYARPVDARVEGQRLTIVGQGDLTFQVYAPGVHQAIIEPGHWRLPGLSAQVETNVSPVHVTHELDCIAIHYDAPPAQPISFSLTASRDRNGQT